MHAQLSNAFELSDTFFKHTLCEQAVIDMARNIGELLLDLTRKIIGDGAAHKNRTKPGLSGKHATKGVQIQ